MPTAIRVLILEDRPEDAELMAEELRRGGFDPLWQRVETEADYLAGLAWGPSVILADYHLPGFDAARALRLLQERGLDIPFIVVSGFIGEDLAVATMRQGAADYLLKDRLVRLAPAVSRVLEEKRLREEKRATEEALRKAERRYREIFRERGFPADTRNPQYRFEQLIDHSVKSPAARPEEVDISAQEEGSGRVFSVRDNGIGIQPEPGRLMFRPFRHLWADKHSGPAWACSFEVRSRIATFDISGWRMWRVGSAFRVLGSGAITGPEGKKIPRLLLAGAPVLGGQYMRSPPGDDLSPSGGGQARTWEDNLSQHLRRRRRWKRRLPESRVWTRSLAEACRETAPPWFAAAPGAAKRSWLWNSSCAAP